MMLRLWCRVRRTPSRLNVRPHTTKSSSAVKDTPPPWRSSRVLDEWVQRDARPVSLRQLTVFGRTLTEARLLNSANYVATELTTRTAHRVRDMQTLPYSALHNPHIKHVYEVYYATFDRFRQVPEVKTLKDNDKFCGVIKETLRDNHSLIRQLAKGVMEVRGSVDADQCDLFMNTMLRSRISSGVIADQHLALTETFDEHWHFPSAVRMQHVDPAEDFVGEIFLRCNAAEMIRKCSKALRERFTQHYGDDAPIPEIVLQGNLDTTFPYLPSHLKYIISELLRNSIEAVLQRHDHGDTPPPIEVTICSAVEHITIRVSDQGGGIPDEVRPHLWSFVKGPSPTQVLRNLAQTPQAAEDDKAQQRSQKASTNIKASDSLASLSLRPLDAKFGMGLPISKICAEYWAGGLEVHSLEGYGTDAFLQISRLGNKNENLVTRATMDAL